METKTLILIVLIAAIVIGAGIYFNVGKTVVSAQGVSSIKASPDIVAVNFNVQVINESSEEAKNQMSEIVEKLETSLEDIVDKKDIQTSNLNIYPNYDWSDGKQKITGYTARQDITVETTKLDKVGKIVDKGVDAGALVSYINFQLSNKREEEFKVTALEDASKDAKVKAEAIAKGLGKRLGGVVSVASSDFNYYPYPYYQATGAMAESNVKAREAAVNIQPKDLEVTANVQVTYRIW